ncbi:MAG: hypothetical protein QOH66_2915 [Actinomycetota bacterium]|nr:hypothetical protein [Actinomycetota bacterium]
MDADLEIAEGGAPVGAGLDVENEPLWQWVGALCGIAAVLAFLASAFIVPQPPKSDASVDKILTYYVDHRRALLFSQWLAGLGTALFLWFVGSLRGAWGRALDSAAEFSAIAFAGGVALAGGVLAGTGLNLTLVYMGHGLQNSPDLVRTLYTAQSLTFTIVFFAGAVFLAGAGLLTLRRRVGAPWLGVTGVVLAVFDLFAAGAVSDFKGVRSPTGPLPFAAFLSMLAWVLLLSIALTRRARQARAAAAPLP